jgi:transmembrane sensor
VGALLRAQATLALFAPEGGVVEKEETDAPVAARSWRMPALWFAGAAAVAASVAAFVLMGAPSESYHTQVGEVRSLALADGSSVSLDADSRIQVAYGSAAREIRLQSGKVLFRATHDVQRPFRVIVDDIVVTDIGTAFQVIDDDAGGSVQVLVTEGVVRVAYPGGHAELVAGQRAAFAKSGRGGARIERGKVTAADMDRALAWRDGRLDLAGETLDSAVAEINRHSRLRVRISDPALGREQLYGSFRLDDATGFARAAAASLGVTAQVGSQAIVIGPAKNNSAR